jgi:protein-S-isoprenylcysteine O-methyltransferase Ste14
MAALQDIVLACWTAFLVYWIISASSAKPTQETKRHFGSLWLNAGRLALIFLFMEGFGLLMPVYPFAVVFAPRSQAIQIVGVAMVVLGLIIAVLARRMLASNWSSHIDLKKGHELITTGIYSVVRHPIYTGILLMTLGTSLFKGTVGLLIFFLIMLAFMLFKIKEEEELLMEHFPEEYPGYKRRAKALIPFIW